MIATLSAALLGVLTWSFLEYVIHRWLGHDRRFVPNPFATEHIRHHVEGNYFAPTYKKAVFGGAIAILLGVPGYLVAGPTGLAYVGGLLGFYGVYELLHRLEHVSAGLGPYARWARRHHFSHHFVDSRRNHGVTSPLWDLVFGTYLEPSLIPVPRKLAMPWLVDPATSQVRADWASCFVLRAPRSAGRGA